VCVGATTPFFDASAGGTWSSSNPSVAVIGSATGITTGISAGTSTITYSVLIYTATTVVTVNPLPAPITGSPNVCLGFTTQLNDTSSNGVWSSSVISVAPIGSATGLVNGSAVGSSVIKYTLPTGCYQSVVVNVNPNPTPIYGGTRLYTGSNVLELDATPGGTWSSYDPAVASVNPFSGQVFGVSSGMAIIYYTLPTGCKTLYRVQVNSFPDSIGASGSSDILAWYPFCADTTDHGRVFNYDLTNHYATTTSATLTTDRFGNPNDAYLFTGRSMMFYNTFFANIGPYFDYTYSCWFNAGGTPQNAIILYNGKVGSDGWGFTINNGNALYAAAGIGTTINVLFSNVGGPTDQVMSYNIGATGLSQWHNLVLEKKGNTWTFIVDTVIRGIYTSNPPKTPTTLFQVGIDGNSATPGPPNHGFVGKIDDIAVFRRSLSDAEKKSLYNYNPDVAPFSFISGADTTICSDSITLAPYPQFVNSYYTWFTGDTTDSMITVNPSTSTLGNKFWLKISNAPYGCSITDTVLVFKRPIPINLGNDTNICLGDTIMLAGNASSFPGTHFRWNNGDTSHSIKVTTTGKYWVVLDSAVCRGRDTIRVNTHPIPVPNLGPDKANCNGQLDTLRPQYDPGFKYLWSDLSTADTLIVNTSGTFWVKVDDSGCVRYDTINVWVVYDTMTFHFRDTAFCKGGYLQPNLTVNPFATFQWRPTTGIANATLANPTIRPDTSATYILTVSYPHCPDVVDSFHIDVQPYPVVFAGAFVRHVCQGDTLHLSASILPRWYNQYRLKWSPNTHLDNDTFSSVVYTAGLDTTNLMLTVTTPAGCMGIDSTEIYVHPGYFDSALTTSVFVCPRDSVQLGIVFDTVANRVPIIATYHWSPGIYLSDSTSPHPMVRAETDQSYRIIGTNQWGCRDTLHIDVVVKPEGVLNIVPDSVILYPGESYQMVPLTNCVSFSWYPTLGLNGDTLLSNPVANPSVNTLYFVRGKTVDGCLAYDSVYITRDPETLIDIPNAFTPGQGINNKFMPLKRGIISKINTFRVYDRWGLKVFETNNVNDGWDGTYQGKLQPFGVYVYEIEAVTNLGIVVHKTGNLTLIR
jgi:gliding motility-associated-like protein